MPSPSAALDIHTDRYAGASIGYFTKVDKKMRRARGRMRWLQLLAPRGGRFLDVGCNGGFMVEAARERGLDAHGVDVDPVSIDYARRHYPRGTLHAGTIEQLSDALGSFDLVYCSEVIEHVPHARAFISALAAITKPGGYLFLTTPDVYRTPSAFHDPGHCVFYERRGLIGAMRLAGLRHVLTIPQVKPGLKVLFRR